MRALIPDFWGKGPAASGTGTTLSLVPDTPPVDDDENKVGFTADVVMRLATERREDDDRDSAVTPLRLPTRQDLAESA